MSFRGRLTLFFLLIVVMPMIAVAVLVTQVTTQSRNGKADARLAAGLESALTLYRDDAMDARRAANALGQDPALAAALQSGDRAQIAAAARTGAEQYRTRSLVVQDPRGRRLVAVGAPGSLATYRLDLRGPDGRLGSLVVSTTTPSAASSLASPPTSTRSTRCSPQAFWLSLRMFSSSPLSSSSCSG